MSLSAVELAKRAMQAYVEKDRAAMEALLAEDFHFTSPYDNALDRARYFAVCWPNSAAMRGCTVITAVEGAERAFITYEVRTDDRAFRNTELHTARDGKLVSVEVYFGWNIPHDVAPGQHADARRQ